MTSILVWSRGHEALTKWRDEERTSSDLHALRIGYQTGCSFGAGRIAEHRPLARTGYRDRGRAWIRCTRPRVS